MKITSTPITFNIPDDEYNELYHWIRRHDKDYDLIQIQKDREYAIELASKCIENGTLTTLDAPNSAISQKIQKYFDRKNFEMNSLWMDSPQNWVCPCCGRNKFQISRLGNKDQILAKLVIHHDHIDDALEAAFDKVFFQENITEHTKTGGNLINRMHNALSAYDPILICEDCNNIDAKAKKIISQNDHINIKYLSFSIGQIRYFINSEPHVAHNIDQQKLQNLWIDVKPAYIERMKLVYKIAKTAVTQDYWYEKYPDNFNPIPFFSNTFQIKTYHSSDFSMELFIQRMKIHGHKHQSNWSRWRTEDKKPGMIPPENFLSILHSHKGCSSKWSALDDHWICPICYRNKFEITTNDDNKVRFDTNTVGGKNEHWQNITIICNHCFHLLVAMKKELNKDFNAEIINTFSYITPEELRGIIVSLPHTSHSTHKALAKQFVESFNANT